jgi:galacturan 1,4-alpha-galacturonidase
VVRNITFSDFDVEGADAPPLITQDNGNNGNFSGTSKMEVSHITFEDFKGYLSSKKGKVTGSVNCSKVKPCFDIVFRNIRLRTGKDSNSFGSGKCRNIKPGGVKGLSGSGCK